MNKLICSVKWRKRQVVAALGGALASSKIFSTFQRKQRDGGGGGGGGGEGEGGYNDEKLIVGDLKQ